MCIEGEENRLLRSSDECPYCEGIGKLNKPGAPDCPYCRGTGVMESFPNDYPKNRVKDPSRIRSF